MRRIGIDVVAIALFTLAAFLVLATYTDFYDGQNAGVSIGTDACSVGAEWEGDPGLSAACNGAEPAPTVDVDVDENETTRGRSGDDNGDGRIDEDESGWDCHVMGNRVCGPPMPRDPR
uniref:hypothetical protein n=1 Tax=Streptomyces sp. CA-136453 TaxID=3240050 RepID=UPI003F491029